MNNSFDIVCCSLEDWDDVWRRNQFLVRELRLLYPSGRVLFVEPPRDVVHDLRRRQWSRAVTWPRPVTDMPGVWALKPTKILPRLVGGATDRHLAAQVERAANTLGFANPVLWINDSAYATLAGRVRWPCVYDITDDWLKAVASGRELRRRHRREAELMTRSEEVVVCSPTLASSRQAMRAVRIITNAVDAERYAVPAPRPVDLPSDPVAVYVGTLHRDRFDVELVARAATDAPDVQFAYIGPVLLDAAAVGLLEAYPNVHLLGVRPSAMVPAYLQHASVLVVPHLVNSFTDSLDPLKLYEYLAVGRAVVSTSVEGFRDAPADRVSCVKPDEFGRAVAAAAQTNARFSAPTLPSWTHQAQLFADALTAARDAAQKRRWRVLYLDHSAQLSGGELALARLIPAFSRVDPIVVLAEPGPLQARLERHGIRTEVLLLDRRAQAMRRDRVHPAGVPLSTAIAFGRHIVALRSRIRTLRPDVVHTNSLKATVYGSLAARLAGVPVVCHVRDRIADDYLPAPAVFGIRRLLRHTAAVVIVNSHATELTVKTRPTQPLRVVHDAVERPETISRPDGTQPFCVGMIGRLSPWKGQDVFLDAFAAAFANSDARARIVGSAMFGEDAYAAGLHDQAARLGVADRVEFVGFVDDVYEQLALMDLFVHASVIAEPFGQVVVEAMAAGVAVIASAAGGPLEVIEPEVTGVLVPPGDAVALTAALHRLCRDTAGRQRLAAAASATLDRFAPETIAREIEGVYALVTDASTALKTVR